MGLDQCSGSQTVSQTSRICSNWKLVRNAHSQAPPQPYWIRSLRGLEPSNLCFHQAAKWFGDMLTYEKCGAGGAPSSFFGYKINATVFIIMNRECLQYQGAWKSPCHSLLGPQVFETLCFDTLSLGNKVVQWQKPETENKTNYLWWLWLIHREEHDSWTLRKL